MTRTGKPYDKPRTVTGIGWSGLYNDGTLGWLLSDFIAPGRGNAAVLTSDQRKALARHPDYRTVSVDGQRNDFYRVKITIQPMRDKRGRLIVKRGKT